MIKLKPCPFCGGKAERHIETAFEATGLYAKGDYYSYVCECCRARSGRHPTDKEAIEAWNRRAEPCKAAAEEDNN